MDISLAGRTYKNVVLSRAEYGDGSLAITLNDKHGEAVATVSARLPIPPADGCVWVKNYSENAGILEALVGEGLLETTGNTQTAGFATLQEARVLA